MGNRKLTAKEKIELDNQNDDKGSKNNNDSFILEEGNIYFFYRPKKNSTEVKNIDDVRRFFMVTSVNKQYDRASNKLNKTQKQFYRLFVIGKKSLPEVRQSEARSSERYWARVGGIFDKLDNITSELFADEFKKGDGARPVGAGKYVIARHQSHA
ncbi:MAG TPA: hypothetical protein VFT71_07315 [Candidatus Nitrosocosmicus sp.]|nr:hypothetical protein [Candidatus Nitrosocosmicus sp.]